RRSSGLSDTFVGRGLSLHNALIQGGTRSPCMLFLIMQTHDLDHCPAKEGSDSLREYYRSLQADIAEKLGVEVLGLYTAPLHHAQFLILQADDFESLSEYLHPLY